MPERELGFRPAKTWSDAIEPQIAWLVEATRGRDWKAAFPNGAGYLRFGYAAEDELVRRFLDTKP